MGFGDSNSPRQNYFFIDQSVDDNLSEALFKGHLDICGLVFPTMTSTACTFTVSYDNGVNYKPLWWNGAVLQLTIASNVVHMVDPIWFSGVRWLKLATGSNEGADRSIYPIYRSFE